MDWMFCSEQYTYWFRLLDDSSWAQQKGLQEIYIPETPKSSKKNSNTGCAMSRLNSKQIQRIPGAKPATDTKVQVKKLYLGLLTPSVLSPTSNFPIYFWVYIYIYIYSGTKTVCWYQEQIHELTIYFINLLSIGNKI